MYFTQPSGIYKTLKKYIKEVKSVHSNTPKVDLEALSDVKVDRISKESNTHFSSITSDKAIDGYNLGF